ncbi:MAG TPA: PAS domain S-box protein [Pirellulales bacterium]|nr:PAS domain S-box protein [Pirellulales bacterium]
MTTPRAGHGEGPSHESDLFRLLVEGTIDYAIFMLDPTGHILTWNTGAERLKGYSADEIIGEHFSRFYPQEAIDRGWPAHELTVAKAEGRFEDEGWRVRKDGTLFWANVIITALNDQEGNFRGFSKVTRDLTERKRAEENARRLIEESAARHAAEENAHQIHEERERLRVTLASIGDAVIATNAEGRVEFLNEVAARLVGATAVEAMGSPLADIFHIVNAETRRPVENPALRALEEGMIIGLANHTVLISKDGTERPIDDSAAPIRDANGDVIGCVLVFRDVTEREMAEQAIRRSEQQFRYLAEALPQIIWTARPDGQIDYLNRQWTELTGLPPTASMDDWWVLMHADDAGKARERWAASLTSGLSFETEVRWLDRREQEFRWHLMRTIAVRDEADNVSRWFGSSTDIHQQKRAQESSHYLAEASAALASIVDFESTLQKIVNLAVPFFADWAAVDWQHDGVLERLAVANTDPHQVELAQELMRDYPPKPDAKGGIGAVFRTGEPVIMTNLTDELLVKGARDERHLQLMRSLGLKSYVCVPLTVSGTTVGVLTFATSESGRRYKDDDLALAMDLARRASVAIENTQLYQALREADQRKDEFLATLAHELRNPLAPIRNSLEILKMPRVDAEVAQHARDLMERQIHHLVRLVDDLLDVSRVMRGKIDLRKERIELATVIARALETVQPLIDTHRHHLHIRLPEESLVLPADPVRLSQVVVNLLTNAAKYTEPGGLIEVEAKRDGESVLLIVRDNGIGIPAETKDRIFDLFVQANQAVVRSQGGLGIGLTLVRNLVELHNGSIEARSNGPGQGSEFIVRLPLSSGEPNGIGRDAVAAEERAAPSGFRLLIVDDNHDAANSLGTLLQLQGHHVRIAYSGMATLEIAKEFIPDAVLLDIGMPGMDGYEVAMRLRELPALQNTMLIALTGWGQQEDRRRSAEAGFDRHLVKPLDVKVLHGLLEELRRRFP